VGRLCGCPFARRIVWQGFVLRKAWARRGKFKKGSARNDTPSVFARPISTSQTNLLPPVFARSRRRRSNLDGGWVWYVHGCRGGVLSLSYGML